MDNDNDNDLELERLYNEWEILEEENMLYTHKLYTHKLYTHKLYTTFLILSFVNIINYYLIFIIDNIRIQQKKIDKRLYTVNEID